MAKSWEHRWTYNWKNIPTNTTGETKMEHLMSRLEFLELLNKWNRENIFHDELQWIYWE